MTDPGARGARTVKVVHVVNSLSMGGGQRVVRDLVVGSDRERFSTEVICLYAEGGLAKELRRMDVPVACLNLDRAFHARSALVLARELRRRRPDVVHTHLPESCWYGLVAATLTRVPVRVSHLQNCYREWGPRIRLFDRGIATLAHRSIACADAVQDFFVERVGYRARKVQVVHNSVDIVRFTAIADRDGCRQALGLEAGALALVCVALLTRQKGIIHLLTALPAIRDRFPEVVLLVVGIGSERPALEEAAEALGVSEAVRFLGARPDIPQILAAGDVFVLPSLWEGLPLVLVEAGAAGLPAVASRVDGVPEVVEDGVTGLLVAPTDSAGLATAVIRLLGDPAERAAMGARARARAASDFDAAAMVRAVAEVYEGLLRRTRPARSRRPAPTAG